MLLQPHRPRRHSPWTRPATAAVVVCLLASVAPHAYADTASSGTEEQPSAIFILLMSGLAGILIGMLYGAVRALVRRIRAGRHASRMEAQTAPTMRPS